MKRWLKWAAAIVAVVLSGLIVLYFLISSDYVKRLAEAKVRALIGRKVRLERLSIGLFGIEVNGLTVASRSKESEKQSPLLRVEMVRAQINPMDLFYKRVSILRLHLRGALLQASRDDRGRFSFDDIIQRLRSLAPEKEVIQAKIGVDDGLWALF